MRAPTFLIAAAAAALAIAPSAWSRAPTSIGAPQLYGRWQVVAVAVPDSGVQALATNDPAYMGRRLTFTPTRLSWDKPGQASTEAPCVAPTIRPAASGLDPDARATVRKVGGPSVRAFSIGCQGGSWGPAEPPSPTFLALRDGTIALWWYDNGLLKLRRVR